MTNSELLTEYPILNKKKFEFTKRSIFALGDSDKLMDDRGFMIDMFNDWSKEERVGFYNDWLNHVKFILENATAYTSPDKIIALNYPCTTIIPQDNDKFLRWYFVFCHECLHQLWDTFDVGSEIRKEGIVYDHDLLNIASDCVINDYLASIETKHKKEPIIGVTPKWLKDSYGVEYNRRIDTQKSLYLKLLALSKDKQNDIKQNLDKFDGKIKPKDVKQSNDDNGGDNMLPQKHSDDYIKGWHDGIQDVIDKKVDPSTFKPLNEKGDYEKGYNDVLAQIKEGIENGLTMGNSTSGSNSDLARIPWDMDKKSSASSQSTQQSADDAQDAADKGDLQKAQNALDNATKSADEVLKKCKDTAKQCEEAAKNATGDHKKELEKRASECKDAADKLSDAIKNANKSKDIGKSAQNIANKTSDANDAIQNALSEMKNTGNNNNQSNSQQNSSNTNNSKAGDGDGDISTRELIDELKRHGEEICRKYKDYTVGTFGEFVKKCKISKSSKTGLIMKAQTGSSAWNKTLNLECKQYVTQRLKLMKTYKPTYNRVKRGEAAFTNADLRSRNRIIQQGREEIKNKIGFDIALYIDVSGSMSSCIDDVFTAAYSICDELKATFGKDRSVDASKINLKSFTFTTEMRSIPFGKKCAANGGTYAFEKLLADIYKRESQAMLNIVITDGEFNGIDNNKVIDTLKNMNGLFILVTNNTSNKSMYDKLEHDVKAKCGPKLSVIYADSNFTVK